MFTSTLLPLFSLLLAFTLALPNVVHEKQAAAYSTPAGYYGPRPTSTTQATSIEIAPSTILVTNTVFVTLTPNITSSLPSTFSTSVLSSSSSNTTSSIFSASSSLASSSLISSSTPSSTTSSSATSSSPLSATPSPEDLAGVYICPDTNWQGTCIHSLKSLGTSPEACTQLDGEASAIGPDEGLECYFYTNAFCDSIQSNRSDVITLQYPGEADLTVTPYGDYNDKIRSYQCLNI